jgi:NAD(P)-dependent dehydrogenase (short-subunit alcohol dehydrogenase family)
MTNPALPPLVQMSDLTGARVLVTAGTLGIGAAAARRFDEAGAHVVVAARREPSEDVVGQFVRADLATASGVSDLARRTLELLGGIDGGVFPTIYAAFDTARSPSGPSAAR